MGRKTKIPARQKLILRKKIEGLSASEIAAELTAELIGETKTDPLDAGKHLLEYGYDLDLGGDKAAAEKVYHQTIELLDQVSDGSGCSLQIDKMSKLAQDHGIKLLKLGRAEAAKLALIRSRELLDSLMLLDASYLVVIRLSDVLYFLARAERRTGELEKACENYERGIAIVQNLLALRQSLSLRGELRAKLGRFHLGYGRTLELLGKEEEAAPHLENATKLLGFLFPTGVTRWKQ